ncbi:MAG: transcription termination/antitermination protein NusA [Clostridia bacterium]|nr:transcription termination/antitermination protein NusA [Clostridia bacterium]
MVNKDFFQALEDLEAEKGIKKEYFLDALQTALTSAYKKNYDEGRKIEVKLIPEKNTIKVIAYRDIVDVVEDPDTQISLEDAKLIKKTAKIGDTIAEEFSPKDFGRIAAGAAKQVITQKLREEERSLAYGELEGKIDTLITGIIRRIDADTIYLELAGTSIEGVLMSQDQIPGESYNLNDRIRVYIKKLRETAHGVQAVVSRTTPNFVRKLFELEVPEIQAGIVEIKSVAREAGSRTKIAIASKDPNVDALGACVGQKGVRVNNIVASLNGEKIDIVIYSDDVFEYIARALSPAKVVSVEIDEAAKKALVIVPDDKLSLAIGRSGLNVRLAARLTGWKIDVKSESKAAKTPEQTSTNLDDIGGLFDDINLD